VGGCEHWSGAHQSVLLWIFALSFPVGFRFSW
jgi:hypothetical protein